MVFPLLMFPACILYALADLLIPEMARCNAAGSRTRIRYLARRSLRVSLIYGIFSGGVLYTIARPLCQELYHNAQAGEFLRWYAMLAPMLYCDAIIDAMNKGLGQQKICVGFNIFTSAMDVVLLFVLLPKYGMTGYFISFFITHAINAALSLTLLLKTTGIHFRLQPMLAAAGSFFLALFLSSNVPFAAFQTVIFLLSALLLLYWTETMRKEDGVWMISLLRIEKNTRKNK